MTPSIQRLIDLVVIIRPRAHLTPILIGLALISGPRHVQAEGDTYIVTEGDTVVITNQPSRAQRRRGQRLKPRARSYKSCYLEDKRTGEQSLITSPTRAQLRRSRIIWCERAEPRRGATRSKQRRTSNKAKRASKRKQPTQRSKRSLPRRAEAFREFVAGAAQRYGLPEALLWAFMKVESDFIPTAVSRVGAQGLMQLMPLTAQDMGVTDPFDPQQNIYGAAKLISILMKRFKRELPLVISAYHAGGGAVSRREGIPYAQTSQYMTSVLNAYYRYMENPPYLRTPQSAQASGDSSPSSSPSSSTSSSPSSSPSSSSEANTSPSSTGSTTTQRER